MITDAEIIQAALRYYEMQASELRRQLGALRAEPVEAEKLIELPMARKMSPAARKRIAAAQKKRWAEFHAKKSTLAANLAKAREARAAKKKA